ncbi:MAG: hydrogenase maturation nickel metallochaperone HypA [Chloroflexi bacterium]|nr:hydrogenase maturation nickel metallochaperone HypA [Chloroflexota bacterium]
MHELAVTENILAIALDQARAAKAIRVVRISLALGEFSGLTDESISLYFDALSENSIAANATLKFRYLPARLACHNCGKLYLASDPSWRCPVCHSQSAELVSGHECYVESIEVE